MSGKTVGTILCAGTFALSSVLISGCEQKEKIFEIETPRGRIEVEQDKGSGGIGVEVEDKEEATP